MVTNGKYTRSSSEVNKGGAVLTLTYGRAAPTRYPSATHRYRHGQPWPTPWRRSGAHAIDVCITAL